MEFETLYQVDYGRAALRTGSSSRGSSRGSSSSSSSSRGIKGASGKLGLEEMAKGMHLLIHVVSGPHFVLEWRVG